MKDVSTIEKRLEVLDRELHSMLADIRMRKSKIKRSDLERKISSRLKTDEDTTELIRKMRNREY